MNSFREIVCFIASPGDTQEERKACVEVFEDINHGFGKSLGFCLSPFRWDYEVYPSVGEYGQQVINYWMEDDFVKRFVFDKSE